MSCGVYVMGRKAKKPRVCEVSGEFCRTTYRGRKCSRCKKPACQMCSVFLVLDIDNAGEKHKGRMKWCHKCIVSLGESGKTLVAAHKQVISDLINIGAIICKAREACVAIGK